jgi:outer membrane protein OmpA-like peptidoglycan-associated protein
LPANPQADEEPIMNTPPWIAILATATLALAGCASIEPNTALEKARVDVGAASSNPEVIARAPLELRAAQDALDRATAAWRDRQPAAEVNHQAYLAQVRAITAMDLARARRATDALQAAQAESDRVRLAARTREADYANAQARAQARAADDARAQAAAANREASIASQQAAAANREASIASQQAAAATEQAAADRNRAAQAQAEAMDAKQRLAVVESRIIEIEGRHTERGILVTLGDVLFESGKSDLLATARPRLDRLADFLRQFPEKRLLIEGYTDAIGSERYNVELSQRRAEAVKSALVSRGIDPARMVAEGYGKAYPVADNRDAGGRQMNRRVEVVVSDEKGNLKPRA